MDFYDQHFIQKALDQQFAFIRLYEENHVLTLALNRPEKKNALAET